MPTDTELITRGLDPFNENEVRILCAYRRAVAELEASGLAQRTNLTFNFAGGADGDQLNGVTRDEIKSLATDFRKLGWSNEPSGVTFDQVRNLIARHARDAGTTEGQQLLEWFRELKSLRQQFLKTSRVLAWKVELPDGSARDITPREILDVFINGAVFHTDEEKLRRWDALGGWSSGLLVRQVVLAMWDFLELSRALDKFIESVLTTDALVPKPSSAPLETGSKVRT